MKKLKNKIKLNYCKKYKDIKEIIEKRYNIIIFIIIVASLTLISSLFYIQIVKQDYYLIEVEAGSNTTYEGSTAPRGRIYDRNGVLIVDNEPIKAIYYKKESNITKKEEIELSYKIGEILEIDYSKLTDLMKRTFIIAKDPTSAEQTITEEEYQKLKERKITTNDIENYKKERITEEKINSLETVDLEAAYIYYLMNKGYSYQTKIIKNENVTDEEYAKIASLYQNLRGFNIRLDWDRTYPYEKTFKTILGTVSNIPKDLKDYYLNKGYTLEDRVGTSYIEYQYDNYLKGEKNTYQIEKDGKTRLLEAGTRGNDIYLTIDIELQKQIEQILEEELQKSKKEANTKYYNHSFVIVTIPKTGEILAMSGKQIIETENGYEILDYTPGIITSSVTAGSVVKGASQTVGYNTGALKIGEIRNDTCVKLAATPLKCSWKALGTLNDITALKYSSNTYQFYTAMKVAGYNYVYNGAFKIGNDAFETYRNTFNSFGLGVKTEIDLPNESIGQKGKVDTSGLLLDFSIGQYDTYTPMQLAQYIGTIANDGDRMKMQLLKKVISSVNQEEVLYESKPTVLNKVDTKSIYLSRIKEGFREVIKGGTGYGYIDSKYKAAGKTGTSQSFIDTDNDKRVDKETLTHTFVAYAPYDNPEVAFIVVSPDVYYNDAQTSYTTNVNKRITKRISDKYFELYQ